MLNELNLSSIELTSVELNSELQLKFELRLSPKVLQLDKHLIMICSVENVLGHHSYGLLLQQEIGVCVTEDTKRRRRHTLFSEEKSSIFRSITIASHKFSTITPQK